MHAFLPDFDVVFISLSLTEKEHNHSCLHYVKKFAVSLYFPRILRLSVFYFSNQYAHMDFQQLSIVL